MDAQYVPGVIRGGLYFRWHGRRTGPIRWKASCADRRQAAVTRESTRRRPVEVVNVQRNCLQVSLLYAQRSHGLRHLSGLQLIVVEGLRRSGRASRDLDQK